MVSLFLANKNPDSPHSDVVVNLSNGVCVGANNLNINRNQLLHKKDFIHPLLLHKPLIKRDNVYHYEYDDVNGMLESAIHVYATLLHSQNPEECVFKITPSALFDYRGCSQKIHFSINENDAAVDTIHVEQLENIVSKMNNIIFRYSEKTVIQDRFTMEDFPAEINGDSLYFSEKKIFDMLAMSMDLQRLEIRYINPQIGLGVYSRDNIAKNEIIGMYSGIKQVRKSIQSIYSYSFISKEDSLNMQINAWECGNITRFINHAPDSSSDARFLEANIIARNYCLNGVEFVLYSAQKMIPAGTQLLVSYGDRYFKRKSPGKFKANGRRPGFISICSSRKACHIRIMAEHGVVKAQIWLFLRILIISGMISIAVYILLNCI